MGTVTFSTHQARRLGDVVDACRDVVPGRAQAASWAVLEALQELVGCDAVMLNALDSGRRRHDHVQGWASGESWCREDDVGEEADAFWAYYDGCRPCSYPDLAGTRVVVSHGDFYTRAEWLRHPMRREVLTDVTDEVVMAFPDGAGRTVRYLFPRSSGTDFDATDKLLLSLLQPHLETLARAVVPQRPVPVPALTPRQWEILGLVRLGRANKEIARRLELSPATVRKHLENIFQRLEVQSRGAAVHAAFAERPTGEPGRELEPGRDHQPFVAHLLSGTIA